MFELKHKPIDDPTQSGDGPLLACTGAPAPAGLGDDARALLALPEPVKARFGEVLAPYLDGDPSAEQAAALEALCKESELDPQRLVPAIKAARFLVEAAARTAQTREGFSEDIARLDDDPRRIRELIEVLLPCFEREAPRLQERIARRTLADHGKLVEETHWRIDRIVNSEHGDGINLPVATLTFNYRDGEAARRITLQLLPEQLSELKHACQQMMPDLDRSSGD